MKRKPVPATAYRLMMAEEYALAAALFSYISWYWLYPEPYSFVPSRQTANCSCRGALKILRAR
jgi:hypothetical protein